MTTKEREAREQNALVDYFDRKERLWDIFVRWRCMDPRIPIPNPDPRDLSACRSYFHDFVYLN